MFFPHINHGSKITGRSEYSRHCDFTSYVFRAVPWCGGVGGSRLGGGRLHLTIESTMVALLLDEPIVQWILSKSLILGSDGMLIST